MIHHYSPPSSLSSRYIHHFIRVHLVFKEAAAVLSHKSTSIFLVPSLYYTLMSHTSLIRP